MFESDDSGDDFDSSSIKTHIFKTKEEVPHKVWAEYFVAPEKERNVSLTNLFEKEFIRLKGMYCFLDETQVMGKTLSKLGIPNILGKVNKKCLLVALKSRNKSRRLDKSGRHKSATPYRPFTKKIFTSKYSHKTVKRSYPLVAERWSDIALKKFKCNSNHKPSFETYNFNMDECEGKNKLLDLPNQTDTTYYNSSHQSRSLYRILESTGTKITDKKLESDQKQRYKVVNVMARKENSNTSSTTVVINEPICKPPINVISERLSNKKTVRFNDVDLCMFAPTQVFKDTSQQRKGDEMSFNTLTNPVSEPLKQPGYKELFSPDPKQNQIKMNLSLSKDSGTKESTTSVIESKIDSNANHSVIQAYEIEPYDTQHFLIEDWTEVSSSNDDNQKCATKTNSLKKGNEEIKPKHCLDNAKNNFVDLKNKDKVQNQNFGQHFSNDIHTMHIPIEDNNQKKDENIIIEETPSNSEHSNEIEQHYSSSHKDIVRKKHNVRYSKFRKVCYIPDKDSLTGGDHCLLVDQIKTEKKNHCNDSMPSNADSNIEYSSVNDLNINTNTQTNLKSSIELNKFELSSPLSDRDYISDSNDRESDEEICDKARSASNEEGGIKARQNNSQTFSADDLRDQIEHKTRDNSISPVLASAHQFNSSQISTADIKNGDVTSLSDIIISDIDSEKHNEHEDILEVEPKINSMSTSEKHSVNINESDGITNTILEPCEKFLLQKDINLPPSNKTAIQNQNHCHLKQQNYNTVEMNQKHKPNELSSSSTISKSSVETSGKLIKYKASDSNTPLFGNNKSGDMSNSQLSLVTNAPLKKIKVTASLDTTVVECNSDIQKLHKNTPGENKTRKRLFYTSKSKNISEEMVDLGERSNKSFNLKSLEKITLQKKIHFLEEQNQKKIKNDVSDITTNNVSDKPNKTIIIEFFSLGKPTAEKTAALLNRKIFDDVDNTESSYQAKLNSDSKNTSNMTSNDDIKIQSNDLFSQRSPNENSKRTNPQIIKNNSQRSDNSSYFKTLMYCKQYSPDTTRIDNIDNEENNTMQSTSQSNVLINTAAFWDSKEQIEANQNSIHRALSPYKKLMYENLEESDSLGNITSIAKSNSEINNSLPSNTANSSLIMLSHEIIRRESFNNPEESSISEKSIVDLESKDSFIQRSNPVSIQHENETNPNSIKCELKQQLTEHKYTDRSKKIDSKKQSWFRSTLQLNRWKQIGDNSNKFGIARNERVKGDRISSSLESKLNIKCTVDKTGKKGWINVDPSLSQEKKSNHKNSNSLSTSPCVKSSNMPANKFEINNKPCRTETANFASDCNEIFSPNRIYAASATSINPKSKNIIKNHVSCKAISTIAIKDQHKYFKLQQNYKSEKDIGRINNNSCISNETTKTQKENNRCDEVMFKNQAVPSISSLSMSSVEKLEIANNITKREGSVLGIKPKGKNNKKCLIGELNVSNQNILNVTNYDINTLNAFSGNVSDAKSINNNHDQILINKSEVVQKYNLKTKNKITKRLLANRGHLKDVSNLFSSSNKLQVINNGRRNSFTNNNNDSEIETQSANINSSLINNKDPKLLLSISRKNTPFKNNANNSACHIEIEPKYGMNEKQNLAMSTSNISINNKCSSDHRKRLLEKSAKKGSCENQVLSTHVSEIFFMKHTSQSASDTSSKYSENLNENTGKDNTKYNSLVNLINQGGDSMLGKTTSNIIIQMNGRNLNNIDMSQVTSNVRKEYVAKSPSNIDKTPKNSFLNTKSSYYKSQDHKAYRNLLTETPEYSQLSNSSPRNSQRKLSSPFKDFSLNNNHHTNLYTKQMYNYAITSEEDSDDNINRFLMNGQSFYRRETPSQNGNGKSDIQLHNYEDDSIKLCKYSTDNLSDACLTEDTDDSRSIISENDVHRKFTCTISDDEELEHQRPSIISSPPHVSRTDIAKRDHMSDMASTMKTDPSFPSMSEMEYQFSSPLGTSHDEELIGMFEQNSSPVKSHSSYSSDIY